MQPVALLGLAAGNVREEAKPGVGLDTMVQPVLYAINCHQPDLILVQPNHPRKFTNADRLLKLYTPPPGLIGKKLTKYLDINGHNVSYKVSNTVSRSESGTSNTTLCGGNGSSHIYSGIL